MLKSVNENKNLIDTLFDFYHSVVYVLQYLILRTIEKFIYLNVSVNKIYE